MKEPQVEKVIPYHCVNNEDYPIFWITNKCSVLVEREHKFCHICGKKLEFQTF